MTTKKGQPTSIRAFPPSVEKFASSGFCHMKFILFGIVIESLPGLLIIDAIQAFRVGVFKPQFVVLLADDRNRLVNMGSGLR